MRRLTKDEKREACAIASVGCDRDIAARYLGCTLDEFQAELARQPTFARDLAKAEAAAELVHMKNLKIAAEDEKNWRASVWWLERRSPERYGRRNPTAIPAGQLQSFLSEVAQVISDAVADSDQRAELLQRIESLARDTDQTYAPVSEDINDSEDRA